MCIVLITCEPGLAFVRTATLETRSWPAAGKLVWTCAVDRCDLTAGLLGAVVA